MLITLLLAIFPACPSDGLTHADPPVCVWDASADGVYNPSNPGQSFIATSTDVVYLTPERN